MAFLLLVTGCGGSGAQGPGDATTDGGADRSQNACTPQPPLREEITEGEVLSLAIGVDAQDGVHVAYRFESGASFGRVDYAYRDPETSNWTIQDDVIPGGAAGVALAVEASGVVHVASSISTRGVNYARRAPGQAWEVEEDVPVPPLYIAMAVDQAGTAYVCGTDGGQALRCAWRLPAGTWDQSDDAVQSGTTGAGDMAITPDGVPHVIYWVNNPVRRPEHAWKGADDQWQTEVLDGAGGAASGFSISLAADEHGDLRAAFVDPTPSSEATLDRWAYDLRFATKHPGDAGWSSSVAFVDADIPAVFAIPGGDTAIAYLPLYPFGVAHELRVARLIDGAWREERFGCGVPGSSNDFHSQAPVAMDGCGCLYTVHLATTGSETLPRTLLYERLCPSDEPTLEPREGDCVTDVCATEAQACRDARCPSDGAVSNCETRLTTGPLGSFGACESYDGTDPCLYDSSFSCIEAQTAADALIDCIRNNCVGLCP